MPASRSSGGALTPITAGSHGAPVPICGFGDLALVAAAPSTSLVQQVAAAPLRPDLRLVQQVHFIFYFYAS